MRRITAAFLLAIGPGLLLATRPLKAAQTENSPDFESQVRPLLQQHCSQCHGPETQRGGLRLEARSFFFRGGDSGPVVHPGQSESSLLVHRITSLDTDLQMPPEGPRLTPVEIQLLRSWIDAGANWPETDYDRQALIDPRKQHWSFQPLPSRIVPPVTDHTPQSSDIDRFLIAQLSPHGLTMNPPADRRTLIRRAYLVMTGLLPAPQQVDSFVGDSAPTAWNSVVEQLLASPHYGERWAQHWLDVIRYADTHGFEVNTSRDNAWPYRDYVIQAFNSDKPWNSFVREQIAGDLLGEDAATGFLVASAVLLPGQIGADDVSKRLARQDALDEIISGTSSSLLGLTLACARCHDHKFDPLTQQDYYSIQAFFAGVEYGERPLRDSGYLQRQQQAATLENTITLLEAQLTGNLPFAAPEQQLLLIDEEDQSRVVFLKSPNGPGNNPAGTQRGYRDDPGSPLQPGNVSKGRYTWWNNAAGVDVLKWTPGLTGHFRLWLSWGAHGSGVHTRDARYVLDQDGLPETRDDQREVFRADQYYPAGITAGTTEQTPLWSGFQLAGDIELTPSSAIFLRGGDTGTGITADVIALQRLPEPADSSETRQIPATPPLRDPVSPLLNIERFTPIQVRFVRFTTSETINSSQHEPCIDELEIFGPAQPQNNLALSRLGVQPSSSGNYSDIGIHQLPHINDGRYGNDFSWISNQRGQGWVQLEFPTAVLIDTIKWARDRSGRFSDRLPIHYSISVSADGLTWTTVADHTDRASVGTPWDPQAALLRSASADSGDAADIVRKLQLLRSQQNELRTTRMVFSGTFRPPDRTRILRRGDPEQPEADTEPQIPQLFAHIQTNTTAHPQASELTEEQQRRWKLADWLAADANPLTARVIVNRVWQHHFGSGLVETPNDFGLNGARPANQPLLDWLALELIRSGWSIKHLHRLILHSAAWQQDSALHSQGLELDRNNSLLWHFSARRMESEAIRDCMLQVTAELNLKTGGPGFSFFQTRGGLSGFPEQEELSAEELRRMVYSHRVRMESVPVFGAFDCPDFGQSMPRRSRSTTAIQALNLFNSRFTQNRATALANRLTAQAGPSVTAQLQLAWQLTLQRAPTNSELATAEAVAIQHGLSQVCRALLNSSEFLFIP